MPTEKMKYIALLRGINVGGNNIIKMVDLKACFERIGFDDVKTYIQSGNVIFTAAPQIEEHLISKIEEALFKNFQSKIPVVVISQKQLEHIIHQSPSGFGTHPELYKYDVIFLKHPLTAEEAIKPITVKEGVDQIYKQKGVLYFCRLIEKLTQSKLPKIITMPIYKNMTIRNWNTTTKLLVLMQSQ